MEHSTDFSQHIRTFESMLRTKGFEGHFAIGTLTEPQPVSMMPLSKVLESYLHHERPQHVIECRFYLYTYAEYLSDDNYKQCRFSVGFTPECGFQVNGLTIDSEFPKESQRLSLRSNKEIPGKNAIIGRFRKPKPWDEMLRGSAKFKWRR